MITPPEQNENKSSEEQAKRFLLAAISIGLAVFGTIIFGVVAIELKLQDEKKRECQRYAADFKRYQQEWERASKKMDFSHLSEDYGSSIQDGVKKGCFKAMTGVSGDELINEFRRLTN